MFQPAMSVFWRGMPKKGGFWVGKSNMFHVRGILWLKRRKPGELVIGWFTWERAKQSFPLLSGIIWDC